MKRIISKKFTEKTTDQQIRARYEELTSQEGVAPNSAVSTLVAEYNLPMEQVLPMLVKWGYLNGPMDKKS